MAISLGTAILGSAIIGGGASVLGARSQNKAINKGIDAQTDATRYAADLQHRQYQDSVNRLEPFRQFGMSAINPLADLLGLDYGTDGVTTAQAGPQRVTGGTAPAFDRYGAYVDANPDLIAGYNRDRGTPHMLTHADFDGDGSVSQGEYGRRHYMDFGRSENRSLPAQTAQQAASTKTSPPGTTTGATAEPANPLAALMETPGYQFRFNEGTRALDASAASRGMRRSGAQTKAAIRYGQDYATGEYDNQINRLLAVMGGGQVATNNTNAAGANYANNVGNNAINLGNARASAYGQKGANNASAYRGVANTLVSAAGAYGGYKGWFGG